MKTETRKNYKINYKLNCVYETFKLLVSLRGVELSNSSIHHSFSSTQSCDIPGNISLIMHKNFIYVDKLGSKRDKNPFL